MVVADLPLTVLPDVDPSVTSLDLVAGGAHGELVDTGILGPVVSDNDVALKDNSLGLLGEEVGEVVQDGGVVRAGGVRHGGEENSLGGVPLGHGIGVEGGKGVVPEVEQVLDLLLGDGLRGHGGDLLRHDGRVVVGNLPLTVLVRVHEGVTALDLVTGGTHGELVDTGIKDDVLALDDGALEDGSLGLLGEEVGEVVLDGGVVRAGGVRHGGEEDGLAGVTLGDSVRVEGGEGVVPQVEEVLHLLLRDGGGGRLGSSEEGTGVDLLLLLMMINVVVVVIVVKRS